MTAVERSFPAHCPNCKMLNAVTANPHCPSPTCPWLRCRCGAMIAQDGTFRIIPEGVGA